MIDKQKIEKAVTMILEAIGEDVNREGLVDTPTRVANAVEELTAGYNEDASTHLNKVFNVKSGDIVVEKGITFSSTCEHHLMPFFGKVAIAYVPKNKVVGLSKLARTVETFAKRLQLQEQLGNQIAEAVMTNLDAVGVMVVIEATHTCMTSRGIKKMGSTTISATSLGIFKDNDAMQNKVLNMIK